MHVIEVIPLTKASHIESLTYYSGVRYPVGTIIDVPIRKQQKRAVVVGIQPVSATKTALKTATFNLRKLPEQPQTSTLPPALIETAKRLSKTTPATLGAILFAILPPEVREGVIDLSHTAAETPTYETPMVSVLQDNTEERLRNYRSKIRETFAHRGSLLLVVPTSAHVMRLAESLQVGIEKRVITFSPTLSKKKLEQAYAALADLSHAKLIIVTPTYCCLDRHDITDIIIEQSHSSYYKSKTRPYLDAREVLTTLAAVTSRQVLFGDILPRTEEESRRRDDRYQTEGETPRRLTLPSKLILLEQVTKKSASDQFQLISAELQQAITDTLKRKGNVLMLAARRGIAPLVACVDCGHVFRCPDSGEPYSLHRTGHGDDEKRWFIAASSGRRLRAPDTCPHCGSWRLKERGIGIQHLESVLTKELPTIPLIVFDHVTASTPRKAQQLMSAFYDERGAILLATPMVLPYVDTAVSLTAIPSLEATRAVPTWRAEESYLALLLQLRELTDEQVLVQSRTGPDELFEIATQGLVGQFYDDELGLREQLSYPPFNNFVHITLQGPAETVRPLESEIERILYAYKPKFYSAPQFMKNGVRRYGLIRISAAEWPDQALMDTLRQLPPSVRIEINPERIV